MEKIYYVGIHRYSFRAGKPALIKRIVSKLQRDCYEIEFEDGFIDYAPLCDKSYYKIISNEDFLAGKIPEVTE